ncbi:magnesium/cobalt transporter CorA [Azospirillum picis]|uniref:Magnesium transport protein CorA n=1 Tax=Azospirillum picis TaxID=488438 RepID=A0ABU0MPG8_9PROT|nr:magnesium/cobalt transporter CorA [Azospirillum picis]MBP2301267.1 magnesium transporter [Azospirillum picis]MDQ0535098.1 magnesium transporter [Azospirillum picis]
MTPLPPPEPTAHPIEPPATRNGVVASAAYRAGCRIADVPIAEAGNWAKMPDTFVWIGLLEPEEGLLDEVKHQFGLHELAVEDALHAHQRPKVEVYGDSLFMVLRTARLENNELMLGETHVFAGKGYVVTVRHGASSSYATVRARVESAPSLLKHGEDFVVYAIMDHVVDCYFPVLDQLAATVDDLDTRLISRPPGMNDVECIHQLRRDMERLRRNASPLLEVCSRLERFDLPIIDPVMRPYYRDVQDHVIRVNDQIGSLREVLSFAFETSMILAAGRQNDVTRKLAAWAAILAVPTAIAGLYGMNFEHMPELHWRYGYPAVLAVIAVSCVALYVRFKRAGWL